MRLAAFDLYRYRIPLTAPLPLSTGTLHEREGLLIRLTSASGASGWGEAAPLPGFSTEMLDAAEAQLRQLQGVWTGKAVDLADSFDASAVERRAGEEPLLASAQFGVDLALADLLAAEIERSLPEVLAPTPRSMVALNALLIGAGDDVVAQARRLRAEGYRAVKLKVGRRPVHEEADRVRRVAEALGPDVALRLDANRAWTLDEALAFAEASGEVSLQYVEEPLAEPRDLPALAVQSGLPIALDESLLPMGEGDLAGHTYARAVILKPTLLGGLARSLHLGRTAHRLGMIPVVSAAFESGVGLRGLVALAAALPDAPVGLDTYRWLARDVVQPRLPLQRPMVEVASILPSSVTMDRLTCLEA